MRALCWNGVNDLRVETVTDPEIVNPHDAILRVTLSTTCGSDLHFIDGYIPTMKPGDVIGHEFMGEVDEVGPEVKQGEEGRPGGRAVVHRLRPVLVLPAPALLAVRQHASRSPSCRSRCSAIPRPASTATPTPSAATPARTPSTSACPFADNDCFKVPEGAAGRAGAVPLRRRAHRLHGRRLLRHPAGRHRRGLGLRRRRADGPAERPACWAPSG